MYSQLPGARAAPAHARMSINTLRPHKANSRPGNCTRPLEAETLDKLKPQKKIIVAANQIKLNHETAIQESASLHVVQRNQEKRVCGCSGCPGTARSPQEGTEEALGDRERALGDRAAQPQHTSGTAAFSTQLMGKALTICLTCNTQGSWQGTAGHGEKCPLGCPGDTSWCPPSWSRTWSLSKREETKFTLHLLAHF